MKATILCVMMLAVPFGIWQESLSAAAFMSSVAVVVDMFYDKLEAIELELGELNARLRK